MQLRKVASWKNSFYQKSQLGEQTVSCEDKEGRRRYRGLKSCVWPRLLWPLRSALAAITGLREESWEDK